MVSPLEFPTKPSKFTDHSEPGIACDKLQYGFMLSAWVQIGQITHNMATRATDI